MGNPLWKCYAVCRARDRECRLCALLLLRRLTDKDGEFRTERLAEMTAYAAINLLYDREMVALDVESTRHFQYAARAVLNTELTALAAFFNDNYIAPANVDFFSIKGRAPEFHRVFFLEVSGLIWAGCAKLLPVKKSKKEKMYTTGRGFFQV